MEFVRRLLDAFALPEQGSGGARPLERASAILLLECARADHAVSAEELDAVRQALQQQYSLQPEEADALMRRASADVASKVSLHEEFRRLNDALQPQEKRELMLWLWRIAFVDGRIDPLEEHLLRRFADLMYLPHRDFIGTRLQVTGGGDG